MEEITVKQKLFKKSVQTLLSVKFHILITTTLFFLVGKLSEQTFKEIILVIAGIRSFDKLGLHYLKSKNGK